MTQLCDAFSTRFATPVVTHESGPLQGKRFAVKELFDVAGVPTTAGNPDYAAWHGVPRQHAEAVSRLLNAGAILTGKTHTHELAYGITGINPHYGTPANPAGDAEHPRIPGGSSSGSAVAVAHGDVDFALGTDTAGSIRVPAAFCGIWGYRPSWGAISSSGVVRLAPSLDTVGVLTRTPKLLQQVGRMLWDTPMTHGVQFQRVLILKTLPDIQPEAHEALNKAAQALKAFGLHAEYGTLSALDELFAVQRTIQYAEALGVHQAWFDAGNVTLGEDVRLHFTTAASLPLAELGQAISRRAALRLALHRALGQDTLLLLPAAAGVAPSIASLAQMEEAMRFRVATLTLNAAAGIAGLPVVCMPTSPQNTLPLGVQLLAAPGRDDDLLSLSAQIRMN